MSFALASQPATDSVCVYGFPFQLRTNSSVARCEITRLYRHFLSPNLTASSVEAVFCSDSGNFWWQLGERASADTDLRAALWGFEASLCEAILRWQRRWIALHAATVYAGNSAVMLVGPSGAGKSTLSVALSRHGFPLATDDVALVAPETLSIHPIPRFLHLDQRSLLLLEEDGFQWPEASKRFSFLAPVDLNSNPIPVCKAGLLIYIAGPRIQQPQLKPISQSEMAARLLSETGQGPLTDSQTLAVLVKISTSAACFTLTPGPLSATASAVSKLILQQHQAAPA